MFFKDGWEWAKVYFELVGKDRNILWVCGSGRKFWIVGWGWMVLGTGTFWLYERSFGVYFRLLGMGGHFFMSGWGLMGVFTLFCIFFFKFELELIYKLNFKVCFSLLNLKFVHFKLRSKTNQNQNIIKIKAYSLQVHCRSSSVNFANFCRRYTRFFYPSTPGYLAWKAYALGLCSGLMLRSGCVDKNKSLQVRHKK